jgi:parallel beta-helix repeat protein
MQFLDGAILDGSKTPSGMTNIYVTATNGAILDGDIRNAPKTGISLKGALEFEIGNCKITGSKFGALRIVDSSNVNVHECAIWRNCLMNQPRLLDSGWPFAVGSVNSKFVAFADNDIFGNYGEGICLGLDSSQCTVIRNYIRNNYSALIYLNGPNDCRIAGNTCWNDDKEFQRLGFPSLGISLADERSGGSQRSHEIEDNVISGAWKGIKAAWQSSGLIDCTIQHNDIRYCSAEYLEFGAGDYRGTILIENWMVGQTMPAVSIATPSSFKMIADNRRVVVK